MFSGLDATGKPIRPPYSHATVKRKAKRGQPYDRVTGFDTGGMYSQMFVNVVKDGLVFYSESPTANLFTKKYGGKVWGLNQASLNKYVENSKSIFIANLRKKLKL